MIMLLQIQRVLLHVEGNSKASGSNVIIKRRTYVFQGGLNSHDVTWITLLLLFGDNLQLHVNGDNERCCSSPAQRVLLRTHGGRLFPR